MALARQCAMADCGYRGSGIQADADNDKNDKKETEMELGNVKWFDIKMGVGEIEPDEGDFVHVDMAALRKAGVPTLREGQLVAYELDYGRGRSAAENLRVL